MSEQPAQATAGTMCPPWCQSHEQMDTRSGGRYVVHRKLHTAFHHGNDEGTRIGAIYCVIAEPVPGHAAPVHTVPSAGLVLDVESMILAPDAAEEIAWYLGKASDWIKAHAGDIVRQHPGAQVTAHTEPERCTTCGQPRPEPVAAGVVAVPAGALPGQRNAVGHYDGSNAHPFPYNNLGSGHGSTAWQKYPGGQQ